MMKSFYIHTLGCKVNSYESQAIKELLINNNYFECEDNPDIIIVNTCAVTKMAEHKSKQKVSSFAKKYEDALIVVCGCSSQLHVDKYSNIKGVGIILSNNNHSKIIEYINRWKKEKQLIIDVDKNTRLRQYQCLNISSFDEKVRAFVKIGDGCNNFCSYCVIPYTRGNLRSRNNKDIIDEINRLVNNGYQEIVVTGIDMASYGLEFENYDFISLLEDIVTKTEVKRLRISSFEASHIDERFINLILKHKQITPHLHIPLQSGSDSVLKRMKRKYTCDEFYDKIKLIKNAVPDIALACDVIVGFPGESEEEFNETYEFIKKCGFNFLHVFPFSPREGTVAYSLPNKVDDLTKKERVKRLIALGDTLQDEYKNRFIDKEVEVLIESYDEDKNLYYGLTPNYLECYVKSDKNIINNIVKVKYKLN